ncbi:DNA topoisomerase 6 subunit A [Orobanche hederae]
MKCKRSSSSPPSSPSSPYNTRFNISPPSPFTLIKTNSDLNDLRKGYKCPKTKSLKELGLNDQYVEVEEVKVEEIIVKIDDMLKKMKDCINVRIENYSYEIPSRAAKYQVYLKDVDRFALKRRLVTYQFKDENRKVTKRSKILEHTLKVIRRYCVSRKFVLKRSIYYSDKNLYKSEETVDDVLGDICCMFGCSRASLYVEASGKGRVAGNLKYNFHGSQSDCAKNVLLIHRELVDGISDMRSDANLIIVVEKICVFEELRNSKIYETFPCIIITGSGQPDIDTRLLVKKLSTSLNLPVVGLMDCDPYGFKIMSVYSYGSQSMSFDGYRLTTLGMQWLGLRPSDVESYSVKSELMGEEDIKFAEKLLDQAFVKNNEKWVKELSDMVKMKQKSDIQALAQSFRIEYLMNSYLPRKLQHKDWF